MFLQSASVRAQCSAILLAFLLDYPLGGARLAHHLNFLVANAGFEHEAGREAALDAMLVRTLALEITIYPLKIIKKGNVIISKSVMQCWCARRLMQPAPIFEKVLLR